MTDTEITIAMAELDHWKLIAVVAPGQPVSPSRGTMEQLPDYLNDANAVLPLLEKWRGDDKSNRSIQISQANNCEGKWFVELDEEADGQLGTAPTFCRAACEAILRAHGKWRDA